MKYIRKSIEDDLLPEAVRIELARRKRQPSNLEIALFYGSCYSLQFPRKISHEGAQFLSRYVKDRPSELTLQQFRHLDQRGLLPHPDVDASEWPARIAQLKEKREKYLWEGMVPLTVWGEPLEEDELGELMVDQQELFTLEAKSALMQYITLR